MGLGALVACLLATVVASNAVQDTSVDNRSVKSSPVSPQLNDGQPPLDADEELSGSDAAIEGNEDGDGNVEDAVRNGTQAMPSVRRGYARLAFNNCGEEEDPLYITGFDVEPNPVQIPGPLSVGISFRINENLTSPISVQLEMQKKLTFLFGLSTWFTIPCLPNGVGSCGYEDICKLGLFSQDVCLDPYTDEEIPCKCPFHEGDWKMKPSMFNIPDLPDDFPNYLLQGEFFIKATIFKGQEQISCYSTDIEVNL